MAALSADRPAGRFVLSKSFDADGKFTGAVQLFADSVLRALTRGNAEVRCKPCVARQDRVERKKERR